MTQNTLWNIDSNQVMTQLFESTVDFFDLFGLSLSIIDIFVASIKFRWPIWSFH